MISLEEYLEDGGWEGEAREEWRKEFLDGIDTSKDGFLDRAEVIGIVPTFLFHLTLNFESKCYPRNKFWGGQELGGFHEAES